MSNHVVPLRVYFSVFGALMVLTAITVAVAFFDLGVLNNVVALGIAGLKATLVILYFMHVRYSGRLIVRGVGRREVNRAVRSRKSGIMITRHGADRSQRR